MNADLTFDIEYGYWFNQACERFYRHVDLACNFVQLIGGSGAALAAMSGNPQWVVLSGIMLAVVAAISLLTQPAVCAERHMRAKCRFREMKAMMDEDAIRKELIDAQGNEPCGIRALEVPAYNQALHALGYDSGFKELPGFSRLADAIA